MAGNWPVAQVARELKMDEAETQKALRAFRAAVEVVDAANPAVSFRCAVRQAIEHAVRKGLGDENSVEHLVTYRAADLGFPLKREKEPLSR